MGGVGDFLFGSSEDPTITPTSTKTHSQRDLLDQLTKMLSGQLGSGVEAYGGEMTAKPSELEQTSWDMIQNLLNGGTQDRSNINQTAVDKVLQGTTSVPKYDVGEFDPSAIQEWYKNALVKPAMSAWETDVVPQIQEKFIGQNAGSSGAANRAISGSAADLMSNIDAQFANTLFGEKQNYDTRKFTAGAQGTQNEFAAGQNDLSRILNIPGMEDTDMNSLMKAIGLGTSAGATERGIDQAGLNAEYQKWLASQGYNNPYLNLIPTAVGTSTFENVVDPGGSTQGLLNMLMPALGSYAGSTAGSQSIANSSFFSSARYKKNIAPIGPKIAGIQPIAFEYTDEIRSIAPDRTLPGRCIGFLAEDVVTKFPEAVVFDRQGRPDAVNYPKLFELMGS